MAQRKGKSTAQASATPSSLRRSELLCNTFAETPNLACALAHVGGMRVTGSGRKSHDSSDHATARGDGNSALSAAVLRTGDSGRAPGSGARPTRPRRHRHHHGLGPQLRPDELDGYRVVRLRCDVPALAGTRVWRRLRGAAFAARTLATCRCARTSTSSTPMP